MTLTIEFSPVEQALLKDLAQQEGIEPAALVKKLVAAHLPPHDPIAHVDALLAQWQAEDQTPSLPPTPTRPGETPMEALFRTWDEEDAALSPEEQAERETVWEQFQQDVNETRAAQGMRTLF